MSRNIYDQWVFDTFDVDPSTYPPFVTPPPAADPSSSAPMAPAPSRRVVVNAGEDAVAARTIAGKMAKAGRQATSEDVVAVSEHVAETIPLKELKQLENEGVTFAVTRGDVTTQLPFLATQQPRGYAGVGSWTGVPGTYYEPKRQLVIATQAGPNGKRVVPGAATSTSADVVAHETGHALNYLSVHASDSAAFKAAYSAPMTGRLATDPYYHQPDPAAARDETFAESHAMAVTRPQELQADSPALYAYWQNRLSR